VARQVGHEHAVTLGQRRRHGRPIARRAAQPVEQDDGRPGAGSVVADVDAPDRRAALGEPAESARVRHGRRVFSLHALSREAGPLIPATNISDGNQSPSGVRRRVFSF